VPQFVKGDAGRLRQVLIYLLENAIKFTDQGEVILRVRIDENIGQKIRIKFSITDTGIGIPRNRMDHLFQSFSQIDDSMSRKHGGSGLGLAMSKQIVELMKGRIGVQSIENEGSTFWFTALFESVLENERNALLQPDTQTAPAPEAQNVEIEKTSSRSRVLIIEENMVNQRLAAHTLKNAGIRVDAVSSADDALSTMDLINFELLFISSTLPNDDCNKIISNMRNDSLDNSYLKTPIVIMHEKDNRPTFDYPVNGFICKPLNPETFSSFFLELKKDKSGA
jgi:CheY-like chemotaxis protein